MKSLIKCQVTLSHCIVTSLHCSTVPPPDDPVRGGPPGHLPLSGQDTTDPASEQKALLVNHSELGGRLAHGQSALCQLAHVQLAYAQLALCQLALCQLAPCQLDLCQLALCQN